MQTGAQARVRNGLPAKVLAAGGTTPRTGFSAAEKVAEAVIRRSVHFLSKSSPESPCGRRRPVRAAVLRPAEASKRARIPAVRVVRLVASRTEDRRLPVGDTGSRGTPCLP